MYNKNVAVTGRTIRETTSYDYFREDKIRMELYRYIYAIYNEGYRTFLCDMNTYIGLLAADTAIMLRESDKCPDICLVAVIPPDSHLASHPAGVDNLYRALYDDLLVKADTKEVCTSKDFLKRLPGYGHVICCFDEQSKEMETIRQALRLNPHKDIIRYTTTAFPASQSVSPWPDAYSGYIRRM